MRPALIVVLLAPFLIAQSGVPRARCDYGQGVAALRDAARDLARPPASLEEGRMRGEAAALRLRAAVPIFLGCGCPRLAEFTAEASGLAAQLPGEASVARLREGFAQTRLRIEIAQQQMERHGCR